MVTGHSSLRNEAISSLIITVFVQGTEDEGKVLTAFRLVVPEDVPVDRRKAVGHFGNPIVVLKARVDSTQVIHRICNIIKQKLSSDSLKLLQGQIRQYFGEKHTVIIKLDKQAAARGILQLGTNDPIVLRARLSPYHSP